MSTPDNDIKAAIPDDSTDAASLHESTSARPNSIGEARSAVEAESGLPPEASTSKTSPTKGLQLITDPEDALPTAEAAKPNSAESNSETVPRPTSPTTPRTPKQLQFAPLARQSQNPQQYSHSSDRDHSQQTHRRRPSGGSRRSSQHQISGNSPTSPSSPVTPPPDLNKIHQDLRVVLKLFTVIIPSSIRWLRVLIPPPLRRLGSFFVHWLAKMLHKRGALASNVFYDFMVTFWKMIVTVFFREIRSRGAWKVPREGEGAVIFVVGPHANQFLDPLLLMSEVRREAGRRISFLVAAKSMDRKFIGQAASLMQSIPVARAQDLAYAGKGTISLSAEDALIVIGHGTSFKTEFDKPRCQIMLPRNLGSVSVEVAEVLDDNKLKLKKEFSKKACEGWKAKGSAGVNYKILPYVDQSKMYSSVYKRLAEGACIGIFPEGGSHDRTDLLPLKAGVSIMALGALSADPNLKLRIVPVGLSYFHPHKFRSRAVVEFGSPIEIPAEFVSDFEKGGDAKRKAISDVMVLVVDGLKSVTVRAPDFETLMLIQAARRLYRPPGQHLSLGQIVELNKRFIAGYEHYKDEPRLKNIMTRVAEYNKLLRYMGLKDHQVERVKRPLWKSLILLGYRLGLASVWSILALPGVILNAPIFIAAKLISRRKAKEALAASTVKVKGNDVLATWKVLVAMAGAPTLYTVYAIGATVLAFRYELSTRAKIWAPVFTMIGLPLIGYSALKFGEVGMDVYKSLRPMFLSVVPGNEKQLDKLRTMRSQLQADISALVEELAPALFDDFHTNRIVPASAHSAAQSGDKRSSYGPAGKNTFLTHPMSWLDEQLFGWSESGQPAYEKSKNEAKTGSETEGEKSEAEFTSRTRSGYVSGYTTEEPDYDEVINILSREQGHGHAEDSAAAEGIQSPNLSRYRRNSARARSRSQLDLTALNEAVATGVDTNSNGTKRK